VPGVVGDQNGTKRDRVRGDHFVKIANPPPVGGEPRAEPAMHVRGPGIPGLGSRQQQERFDDWASRTASGRRAMPKRNSERVIAEMHQRADGRSSSRRSSAGLPFSAALTVFVSSTYSMPPPR
jgi:hypothetical protein